MAQISGLDVAFLYREAQLWHAKRQGVAPCDWC